MRAALRQALLFAGLVGVFGSTGCYKATFADSRVPAAGATDVWVNQYAYGLIGSPELDARTFCSAGVARITIFENAGTLFLSFLSLGIYTPRVAEVSCARADP